MIPLTMVLSRSVPQPSSPALNVCVPGPKFDCNFAKTHQSICENIYVHCYIGFLLLPTECRTQIKSNETALFQSCFAIQKFSIPKIWYLYRKPNNGAGDVVRGCECYSSISSPLPFGVSKLKKNDFKAQWNPKQKIFAKKFRKKRSPADAMKLN